MKKKFLSMIIALVIIFTAIPCNIFADSPSLDTHSADVLAGLGFISPYESEDALKAPVIKADFAQLYADILNIKPAKWEQLSYSDIDELDNSGVLYQMAGLGYVKAKSGTEFGAQDNVKWSDALELTLRILGYKPHVEADGNYWYTCCLKGREIGIIGNISAGQDDLITYSELYNLVYNALDVKLANVTVIRQGYYGEINESGETLLSKYHDIYKMYGVVQAAGTIALSSAEAVKFNTTVGGVSMGMRRFDTRGLIGMNVEMYYLDVNSQKEAVYAVPCKKDNYVLTVMGRDILSFDGKTLRYDNGIKAVSESMDISAADIIYNGKLLRSGDIKEIFTEGTGEFTFIDNNNDGIYEVIVIKRYTNYVIDRVNGSENKIYYKIWNTTADGVTSAIPGCISLDDYKDTLVVDMQGYARSITELKEWDVISVSVSENSTDLITVYCPFESVIGIVSGVEDGDTKKITVKDAEYEFAKSYFSKFGPGTEIEMGRYYTFKLDAEGKIASAYENKIGSGIQGFIIDYALSNGIDEKLSIRMLDEDGNVSIIPCADKVKIDKKLYSGDVNIKNQLDKTFEALNTLKNADVARVVIYSVNPNGEITDINTPYISSEEEEKSLRALSLLSSGYYGFQKVLRRGQTFEGSIWISSTAKIFIVPEYSTLDELASMSDDKFRTGVAINFLPLATGSYVQGFAAGDYDNLAELVVVRAGGKSDLNSDSDMYLVNKVKTVVQNELETTAIEATCIDEWGVKTSELLIDYDGTNLSKYKPGDVIQAVKNNNGLVTFARPVFYVEDPDTGKKFVLKKPSEPDDGQYTNYDEPSKVQFMSVYKREGDIMLVNKGPRILNNGSPYGTVYSMEDLDNMTQTQRNENIFVYDTTKITHIYIFDTQDGKNRFTEATANDIIDYKTDPENYSNILLYSWWGGVRFVIIYK